MYEADWASSGLTAISELIQLKRQDKGLLVANYGEQPYESEIFDMRTYCWCDGEREGHEEECPPNFHYKPTNLIINWYKHCERGISANQDLSALDWFKIVQRCIESLECIDEVEAGYKKLAEDPEELSIAEQRKALREMRKLEVELGMLDEES